MTAPSRRHWLVPTLIAVCVAGVIWSFIGARDWLIWVFEVLPLSMLMVFALSRRSWLSELSYVLLTGFFLIQCLGGRYSVVEVPFPHEVMNALGLERNPADRIGHVFQGAVSAILLREWLLRGSGLQPGRTLFWVVTACSLSLSAAYELAEMVVALRFFSGSPDQWLGMQGDPFDAQWDMTMALVGAVVGQLLLSRLHDHSLVRMSGDSGRHAVQRRVELH